MKSAGISFIELLAALTVSSLLMALAIPGFSSLSNRYQATAAINQFIGAVYYIRSAATTHRTTVTLCPSASGIICGHRNEWHLGAIAFLDADRNGRLDGDNVLLRSFPALSAGHRVYWRSFRNKSYLQINSRGLTNWQNGNLLYCPPDDDVKMARMLIINTQARVRHSPDTDGDGVVENARGHPVVCPER